MLVREAMTRDAVTIGREASVKQALGVLADQRVTALPVVSGDRKVVGIVSEADLIRDLLGHDPRAHEIPHDDAPAPPRRVEQVMSAHVVTTTPETDLAEAVDLLTSTTVKSLPVLDHRHRLVGVLSRSDVVRLLARADERIEAEVDELLRSSGLEDWLVDVHDGAVSLLGPADERATLVARLLAATVPGVVGVTTRSD